MRHLLFMIVTTIGILSLSSCGRNYYITEDFSSKTIKHKKVAILPVKMIFTGRQPAHFTKEDIRKVEEAESKAFQISLYNQILRSTKSGRRAFQVDFQPLEETNAILAKENISIREAWQKSPKELAHVLGVDAVVKETVEKRRYMSDLASYGVTLGRQILTEIAKHPLVILPNYPEKTNDIKASCTLSNGEDGSVLWSMAINSATDWSRPAPQVIDGVNRALARKFPYRY